MADGDYERGRDREISSIQARLKRLAVERQKSVIPQVEDIDSKQTLVKIPEVWVLNGWASSASAWDLCKFSRTHLFSYLEELAGEPEKLLAKASNPVVLVGWSMGGCVAMDLACKYPQRVAGLVLLASTPRMMADENWRGLSQRRLDALLKGAEVMQGMGLFGPPEGKPNPYCADTPEHLRAGIDFLLKTDMRGPLERTFGKGTVPFPVYLFQSEHDGIVRPENLAYLATIFPQAQVTKVPGTEHALPIMIPKEIDDAVNACLQIATSR